MGTPYMPWQQHVADVAGEVDPKTGIPIYRDIIVCVPRQQGKTTIVLIKKIHRALGFGQPQSIRFTAQTKDDAREKWLEHVTILENSPLGVWKDSSHRRRKYFTKRVTNGQEHLRWFNGSIEFLKSGTEKSGHGKTLDLGVISEAFAQIDTRLEVSMRPAMITRPSAQLFIESTAGTAQSIMLNELVRVNRARLEAEPDAPSRVAYFEWSATEDDDPGDPATWARCMPALGYTIQLADVQHEYELATASPRKMAEFRRSYLNLTDWGDVNTEGIIDFAGWTDTGDDTAKVASGHMLGLDVTPDRAWASIGFAGLNRLDQYHVQLVKRERGTNWVIEGLSDLVREHHLERRVAIVARSAAATLADDLERADFEVIRLDSADTAAACGAVYDEITEGRLSHLATGQAPLDAAVAGVVWSSSDPPIFSRGKSTVDISPLYACAAARWAHQLKQADDYDVLATIA